MIVLNQDEYFNTNIDASDYSTQLEVPRAETLSCRTVTSIDCGRRYQTPGKALDARSVSSKMILQDSYETDVHGAGAGEHFCIITPSKVLTNIGFAPHGVGRYVLNRLIQSTRIHLALLKRLIVPPTRTCMHLRNGLGRSSQNSSTSITCFNSMISL